jgi:hypothetical protein
MAKKIKKGKGRKIRFYNPYIVGDYKGTIERDAHGRYLPKLGGIEQIQYDYPNEPGGLEEGIMGIPAWALLIGIVAIGGAYLYIRK